jgi:SAM-dependent methyltransferase
MTASSLKKPTACLGPEVYAQWRVSELGATTEALEDRLLLNFIGDPRDRQILDIGCGDGALTISLAERGAKAVGVDPSSAMINAAIQRAASAGANASFCVGRAESLPFEAQQFDLVVAKTILCFVDDATDMFTEIARVLRPDGRLVIGELGKWSTWAAQRYVRGRLGSSLWRDGHFWTVSELRSLANRAGMTVNGVRGAIYYPRSLLAARLLRRFDDTFGRMTTIGAAFIAMSAAKQ